MTKTIVHEHFGLGPDGPEVKEHQLPWVAADSLKSRKRLANDEFSESDARSLVQARFADAECSICDAIIRSEIHSVAEMEDVFWVAIGHSTRHSSEVLWFVPMDAPVVKSHLPQELDQLMTRLAGVWIGPYYFPDSGFLRGEDIVRVDFASKTQWWGDLDEAWEDAVAFFSTPTGRIFVYHLHGHIGIWDSGRFRDFTDSLASFCLRFLRSMEIGGRDTAFY